MAKKKKVSEGKGTVHIGMDGKVSANYQTGGFSVGITSEVEKGETIEQALGRAYETVEDFFHSRADNAIGGIHDFAKGKEREIKRGGR